MCADSEKNTSLHFKRITIFTQKSLGSANCNNLQTAIWINGIFHVNMHTKVSALYLVQAIYKYKTMRVTYYSWCIYMFIYIYIYRLICSNARYTPRYIHTNVFCFSHSLCVDNVKLQSVMSLLCSLSVHTARFVRWFDGNRFSPSPRSCQIFGAAKMILAY